MNKERIINVIKERWKYYIIGYISGYVISLIQGGVPNIYYLIPIKLSALCIGLGIGTAFYYNSQKISHFSTMVRSFKYGIIMIILCVLTYILQQILLKFNIDITPFIGF